MITPGLRAALIDINGPSARQYGNRSTVFMSPTGKDGYLGSTPNLPTKTMTSVKTILSKIKQTGPRESRHVYFKSGEYSTTILDTTFSRTDNYAAEGDGKLYFVPYEDGTVTIMGPHLHYSITSVTPDGLWKIDMNKLSERRFNASLFLNDRRIYPARFPKSGVYDYTVYPFKSTLSVSHFLIKDTTNFINALSATHFTAAVAPQIVFNTNYNYSVGQVNMTRLSANGTGMFSVSCVAVGAAVPTGLSILGYNPVYGVNLINHAKFLCTEEGEYVFSKEGSAIYLYVKPYSGMTSAGTQVIRENGSGSSLRFNKIDNIVLSGINFKYNLGVNSLDFREYCSNIEVCNCSFTKGYRSTYIKDISGFKFHNNLLFDNVPGGVEVHCAIDSKVENNLLLFMGLDSPALIYPINYENTESIDMRAPVFINNVPIISANPYNFVIPSYPLSAYIYNNARYDNILSHNYNGYIEVTTGLLSGQRRMVCAGTAVGLPVHSVSYSILHPWTPVGAATSPSPMDKVKYVGIADTTIGCIYALSYAPKIIDNTIMYSGLGGIVSSSTVNAIITGNYVNNIGFGYKGDYGGIYVGTCWGTSLKYNLSKNVRRGPGRPNGFALYMDSTIVQNTTASHNIFANSDQVAYMAYPINTVFKNNLVASSRGQPLDFNINFQAFARDGMNSKFFCDVRNNIFIQSSSNNYINYKKPDYYGRPIKTEAFSTPELIYPGLRMYHTTITGPADWYRTFKMSTTSTPPDGDFGAYDDYAFLRVGEYGGHPVYGCNGAAHPAFMVKHGMWELTYTFKTYLSSNAAVADYPYPWLTPATAWFNPINMAPVNLRFDISTPSFKRSTPSWTIKENFHWTDIPDTSYPNTSANYLAWRGVSMYPVPVYPEKYSTLEPTQSYPTPGYYYGSYYKYPKEAPYPNYAETFHHINDLGVFPMSAGFEQIDTLEEGRKWMDPMVNRDFIMDPSSPVIAAGFEPIDPSIMGIKDPYLLSLIPTLTSNPIYGSANWGEWSYGNVNDPR